MYPDVNCNLYHNRSDGTILEGACDCQLAHATGVPRSQETGAPLGPPYGPRHTVGSYGVAFSYERGTPAVLIECSLCSFPGDGPLSPFTHTVQKAHDFLNTFVLKMAQAKARIWP